MINRRFILQKKQPVDMQAIEIKAEGIRPSNVCQCGCSLASHHIDGERMPCENKDRCHCINYGHRMKRIYEELGIGD